MKQFFLVVGKRCLISARTMSPVNDAATTSGANMASSRSPGHEDHPSFRLALQRAVGELLVSRAAAEEPRRRAETMAVMVQGSFTKTSRAAPKSPARDSSAAAGMPTPRVCFGALPTLLLAADLMVIEELSLRGAAGRDLALLACHHGLVQLQVQLFSARSDLAWDSSGEALPPKSFAATLPVASKRCALGVGLRR